MGWEIRSWRDTYWGIVHYYSVWIWDFWWKTKPEWIKVALKPRKIFNKIFIRRPNDNNRGRHWNRKRSK